MMFTATLYIVLCLIVGFIGRWSRLGFWGFLLVSLAVTPAIAGVILLFVGDRDRPIISAKGLRNTLKNTQKKRVNT